MGSEFGEQAKLCLRLQTEFPPHDSIWQKGEQDLSLTGSGGYRACPGPHGERVRERELTPGSAFLRV